jgi:diguanylate cyclase (GGDEF)-like protein/PAS domain S-box-containing protein
MEAKNELFFYRNLIDEITDMVLIVRIRDEKIIFANRYTQKRLGYTLEQFSKMRVEDFRQPLYGDESYSDHLSQLEKKRELLSYGKITTKSGEEFPVETKVKIVEFDGEKFNLAIARDISKRLAQEIREKAMSRELQNYTERLEKMVEERTHKLERNEERFRLAVQSVSDIIYEWDITTDRLFWFGDIDNFLGFEKGTISRDRKDLLSLIHPDDIEKLSGVVEKHRKSREEIEYRIRNSRGEYRVWLDRRTPMVGRGGKALRWIGVCRDITEKKESRKRNEATIKRHNAILKSIQDGYVMIDFEGNILETNDSYSSMVGYSKDELVNMSIMELEVVETPEEIKAHIERLFKDGHDLFETKHRKRSGEVFPVEISVSYTDIEEGRFFSLVRDISERKMYEQLQTLRNRLSNMIYKKSSKKEFLTKAIDMLEEFSSSEVSFIHLVKSSEKDLKVWSTKTLEMEKSLDDMFWRESLEKREMVVLEKGGKNFLFLPIISNSQLVGVVGVGNSTTQYSEKNVEFIKKVSEEIYTLYERHRVEAKIEYMAYYDLLTALPNRELLMERLKTAVELSSRDGGILALCYLDLDGFKIINDTYGHHVGDQLLITLAKRLSLNIEEGDTIARLGGDEFVIVINSLSASYKIETVASEILESVNTPFDIDSHRIHISGSMGITIYPTDSSDVDTLLRHADQAMFEAKKSGRSTYKIYNPIQDEKIKEQNILILDFIKALNSKDQLRLYYQPKIDLRSGKVVGFEALIRWLHPEKGLLSPNNFLPSIEGTPQEFALGEWVVIHALRQLEKWKEENFKFTLSINISPRQIQMVEFAEFIESLLNRYDEDLANWLELEILEVAGIGDTKKVANVMNRCSKIGINFSLDDFGTGYSSLTHFHRLPIDILKIDQNFVKNMLDDERDLDIVEGILRISDTLKRPVVAEGVESVEIGMILLSLGCRYAQGYAIAKPMPSEDIHKWFQDWNRGDIWVNLPEYTSGSKDSYDINVAIFSHREWVKAVEKYIDGDGKKPNLDGNKCQFIRWYRGIGKSRYGHIDEFRPIRQEHTRLHQIGEKIESLLEMGEREEVYKALETLKESSERLISLLVDLARQNIVYYTG